MKFLLAFLLCLLSVCARAATPAFTGFIGTNGILIKTNPTTGIVLVDGGLITSTGVTMLQATQIVNGSFVAATTNIVWVSKAGNDATAARCRLDLPALTTAKGRDLAIAGDTVIVMPGEYNNSSNLLKSGVNWLGLNAPTLVYTNTTNTGRGWGIFDDRFNGATTSLVSGFRLRWSAGIPGTNESGFANVFQIPTNLLGAVTITNPASRLQLDCPYGEYQVLSTFDQGTGMVNVKNCGFVNVKIDTIIDLNLNTNYLLGLDIDSDPVFIGSGATIWYWEQGPAHFKCDYGEGARYTAWWNTPSTGTTGDVYLAANKLVGGNYYASSSGANPNWRSWLTVTELKATSINLLVGGKHYIQALKLNMQAATVLNGNAILWLTAQKVTSSGVSWIDISGGRIDASVQEWEDSIAAITTGFLNTGGILNLTGGHAVITNGSAFAHRGGVTRATGMSIDTSASINSPAIIRTNGLILSGCTLIGTNTKFSITTDVDATNIVKIYGSSATSTATNKVTVGIGPFTVDPLLQ